MPAQQQVSGTVTRKSNGTIELAPSDAGAFARLPAMGDEVTVTIEVTRTAKEAEALAASTRAAREQEVVAAPRGIEAPVAPPADRRRR